MVRRKILFTIFFIFLSGFVFSEELNIIYSGASFSSLYPCGHCPASVGGGLTRRAKVIKEIKKDLDNLIILDSGGLFAGSSLDEFRTNNLELDKQRTDITLKAMEIMGYEAIGVGEDEFNLGLEFLKEEIKKSRIAFISANLELEYIKPFLIKEIGSLKVGISALTPRSVEKFGVKVEDYSSSLKKVFSLFKSEGVNFVILISSLTPQETQKIINSFPQINIVIFNRPHTERMEMLKDTYLLYPAYQAKKINRAKISLEKGKIKECQVVDIPLPLSLKEDKEVKNLLPACFRDADCSPKEGLARVCENPGRQSRCVYLELEPLKVYLITKSDCRACSTEMPEKLLKDIFTVVEFKRLDYRSKEAQQLIKNFSLTKLPAFIFDDSLTRKKEFENTRDIFQPLKENHYLLKPEFSGIFYYLDRAFISKSIDLFIDLYQKDALSLLQVVKSLAESNNYSFKIHLIFSKEKTKPQEEEYLRVLAVKELYPEKFWDYLVQRLKDIESSFWNSVLEGLGMDIKEITKFALSSKAKELLEKEGSLARELGVNNSGVILLNNKEIFLLSSSEGEALEEALK